jgi:hypothetical protein
VFTLAIIHRIDSKAALQKISKRALRCILERRRRHRLFRVHGSNVFPTAEAKPSYLSEHCSGLNFLVVALPPSWRY